MVKPIPLIPNTSSHVFRRQPDPKQIVRNTMTRAIATAFVGLIANNAYPAKKKVIVPVNSLAILTNTKA
jgi:hypothetical protein